MGFRVRVPDPALSMKKTSKVLVVCSRRNHESAPNGGHMPRGDGGSLRGGPPTQRPFPKERNVLYEKR